MADLLLTVEGREILNRIACTLGAARSGRALKRNFMIAFQEWKETGNFSQETLVNGLNPLNQDEIIELNNLLSQLGCFMVSGETDRTYHVNGGIGNDLTGDGSEQLPYKSLAFMMSPSFPRTINAKIRVEITGFVYAGETADEILVLNNDIGPKGCLSIYGVRDPEIFSTSQGVGPFTLTGVTVIDAPARAYTFSVAETFGTDEFYGRWIRFSTGACAGQAVQIHTNDPSDIHTRAGWNGTPAIGDQFQVIYPADTLVIPQLDFELRGPITGNENIGLSRFNMMNLVIDVRDPTIDNNFALRNSCFNQINFCTIQAQVGQVKYFLMRANLNQAKSFDEDAAGLASTIVTNLDRSAVSDNTAGLLLWNTDAIDETRFEAVIRDAVFTEAIDLRGQIEVRANFGVLLKSAAGLVKATQGAGGFIALCYLSGSPTGYSVLADVVGGLEVTQCYLSGGESAIAIEQGNLRVGGLSFGTFSQYGFVYLSAGATISTHEDPTAWTGTLGDILMSGTPSNPSFPAQGADVQDSLANSFAYV